MGKGRKDNERFCIIKRLSLSGGARLRLVEGCTRKCRLSNKQRVKHIRCVSRWNFALFACCVSKKGFIDRRVTPTATLPLTLLSSRPAPVAPEARSFNECLCQFSSGRILDIFITYLLRFDARASNLRATGSAATGRGILSFYQAVNPTKFVISDFAIYLLIYFPFTRNNIDSVPLPLSPPRPAR